MQVEVRKVPCIYRHKLNFTPGDPSENWPITPTLCITDSSDKKQDQGHGIGCQKKKGGRGPQDAVGDSDYDKFLGQYLSHSISPSKRPPEGYHIVFFGDCRGIYERWYIQSSIHFFKGATTQPPLSAMTGPSASTASLGVFTGTRSTPPSPTKSGSSPTKSGTSPAKVHPAAMATSPVKSSTVTAKTNSTPTKTPAIFKPARGPFPSQSVYGPARDAAQKEGLQEGEQGPKAAPAACNASPVCGGLLPTLMQIEADRLFVASYMRGNVYVVEC
ncbi:hypothetical protein ARMGADRAFT_1087832 [Armillaria gallica]|uniref:Uncharacterized protein n=1 Tax=Armillaria gallica TaxID=47427 RepID=A0A2H3CQ11_ARMGA|nr:hypothetical protein ARMGADRAFT_1087832 [Armillaria gallica]